MQLSRYKEDENYEIYDMNAKEIEIASKHMNEILEYQAVLSHMMKRKISIRQTIADWIEKGHINKYQNK